LGDFKQNGAPFKSAMKQQIICKTLFLFLAASSLNYSQPIAAAVTMNFVNADIEQVARSIGAATGKRSLSTQE
jgi:type II secretory pathway component GspD/PulD (secretin)